MAQTNDQDFYARLRAALPNGEFAPPATKKQIAEAEKALGVRFPNWLTKLYLRCNGIVGSMDRYLQPLDCDEDPQAGLVGWNQFLRNLWIDTSKEGKRLRPEVDWDALNPHQFIVIANINGVDWAIDPSKGPQIIELDVRSDELTIVAPDLVEACIGEETKQREIEEEGFRGREHYRSESDPSPAQSDIERLFDIIIAIHKHYDVTPGVRFSTGWYLHRATSARPGESGKLFIIPIGSDEIRIVSRDGNLPFVLRLSAWPLEGDLSCTTWTLKDALIRILLTKDALSLPWTNANERPRPDERELRRLWRTKGQENLHLQNMADVLCARDDRRRVEENKLG